MSSEDRLEFPYRRVCVLGAARSGVGAMALLRHHDVQVIIVDEKPAMEFRSLIRRMKRQLVSWRFGKFDESVLDGCDALVLSPGVPLEHWLNQAAINRRLPILSEVELAYYFANSPICAITGTNGKTTTTSLVGQMLTDAGKNAVVSGNIGRAFSDGVLAAEDNTRDTVLVTEVSSFQLESSEYFHPHVAAILNISRAHEDRYPDFQDYIEAKYKIFHNQTEDDHLILNFDDPLCLRAEEDADSQVWWFSIRKRVPQGAYLEDGTIYLVEDDERIPVCTVEDVPIPGMHNVENTLAALVMGRRIGATVDSLVTTLQKFKGVEHRIEFVDQLANGVRFYNDSKATNLDSLEKALLSFPEPVILVAGGRDRSANYERMNALIRDKVKHLVLIGEAAKPMQKHWGGLVETSEAKDMDEAVRVAVAKSNDKDIVLLSPACASWDMYRDYEDRGWAFKRSVRALMDEQPRA